jgi:hypothetical protein
MISKIWIVKGTTGHYHEDRSQWIVAVFDNKEMADLHCKKCREAIKALPEGTRCSGQAKSAFDKQLSIVDSVFYTVCEQSLYSHLDEFLDNQ